MKLGKRAVWAPTDGFNAKDAAAFAQRVEDWGYSALWIPEALGREPMSHASWLLANTENLILATGIASIYARDAVASRLAQISLNEQSGGRFLMGLGVSHRPFVEGVRGQDYTSPVATMGSYLEAMKATPTMGQPAPEEPKTVIAALGPKMLELSASHADGAHPYLVTPEYTEQARKAVGKKKFLCVEQKVLFETDASKAREVARQALAIYLPLPNYRNNLLRQGFTADEIDNDGGADRLVDAMVIWGDETKINDTIEAHLKAGATQVCIQALNPTGARTPDERILQALAP
ncbi:MAG: TIGR03620 family F420-dependent LLM class oxidoreductase [Alphaproteobacteria bacterium]